MIPKFLAILRKLDSLGWVLVAGDTNIIFLEDIPTASLVALRNDTVTTAIEDYQREEVIARIDSILEERMPAGNTLPPALVPKNGLPPIVDRAITAAMNRTEDRKQIILMIEKNLERDSKGPLGYYEAAISHGNHTYCYVTYLGGAWGIRTMSEPYVAPITEPKTLLEVVDKILARWW